MSGDEDLIRRWDALAAIQAHSTRAPNATVDTALHLIRALPATPAPSLDVPLIEYAERVERLVGLSDSERARFGAVLRGWAGQDVAMPEAEPDIDAIENGGKRWHGEDHRVVSVRWEPYKPDGQRQMKAKGRWQECQVSGDFHQWVNCDRPTALAALEGKANDRA